MISLSKCCINYIYYNLPLYIRRKLKSKSVSKKAVSAPLLKDKDECMDSDSKDEEEEMDCDHERTEAENDVLKKKSTKMKVVDNREIKSLKISKVKPKENALKTAKTKDPKKVKPEIAVKLKTNPKPKIKPKDATKYQSNDTHAQDNMDNNVGVHDMSSSPDTVRDLDEDDEHDEHDGTIEMNRPGLKMADVKARHVKDRLVTTPQGDVVRRENYIIPKILR